MSEAMETFFALVNDQILISSQPTQKEIADLKPKYKAVVNLRGVGEPGQASKEGSYYYCE
jgi:hypothetical protein